MSLLFPCSSLSDPSNTYHYNRTPGTADGFHLNAVPGVLSFSRKRGRKIMLKALLLVIRGIILELVDQLLQDVCGLG